MRRLLVIRWGALGDLIHASAAVQALKQAYPEMEVHWLTSPAYRALVASFAGVDRVWTWEKGQGLWALGQLAGQFRKVGMDGVINLHPSLKSLLFTALVRPRGSAVYRKEKLRSKGQGQRAIPRRHAASDFYQPFQRLFPALPDGLPTIPALPPSVLRQAAVPVKPDGAVWVGLIPGVGAKRGNRAWAISAYVRLIETLLGQNPELQVLLVGGPEERALVQQILDELATAPGHSNPRVQNHCGRYDILGTASVLAQCDVVVGGDTGPMHLAAATGVAVVGIFGPTALSRTGPLAHGASRMITPPGDLACWPCEQADCPYTDAERQLACMRQISVAQVESAVLALLPNPPAGTPER
ncbi:glycosyltransferase family 9 protein [Vampirovibrio chlorellavorus]|uniref:glycosyltransferase family 9 protein n=1 Tax=Vampirovibrio chlorellavorus TaxID=758823 RepID=UPI0026F2A235|nr:glycosyltransferase family 9 protein [Vampirovibrio chlorellavorus]